jgi:hypothetical protein
MSFGIGTFEEAKTIHIPQDWNFFVEPKPVQLESPWGNYSLEFTFNNPILTITRKASFIFYAPVPVSKLDQFKAIMSKIAEHDAMQLFFEKK